MEIDALKGWYCDNWRSGSFKRSLFSFFHTDFDEYDKCKRNLDLIYDIIAADLKIKCKWQRFEEGEI